MDLTTINMFYDACFFDVCVFEGNRTQRDQLCIAFQKFNDECISLGLKENKTWQFDWRTKLGCRKLKQKVLNLLKILYV